MIMSFGGDAAAVGDAVPGAVQPWQACTPALRLEGDDDWPGQHVGGSSHLWASAHVYGADTGPAQYDGGSLVLGLASGV